MQDDSKPTDKPEPVKIRDNPRGRRAWLAARRRMPDGTSIKSVAPASRQKRAIEKAAADARARELRPRVAGPAIPAYWTPIGPSAVASGLAPGTPTFSGRITAIAAGPGGTRVYVGAANGGTWYSENSGAAWTPVDFSALSAGTAKLAGKEVDSLSTGAIAVRFGATAATDTIFVGTGEPKSSSDQPSGSAPNFGTSYYGVGVKNSANGGTDWTLEATDLAGHGVFRIVIDPENAVVVFAATSAGLFIRPQPALPAAAGAYDSWTAIAFPGVAAGATVSDVIVAGRGASRVYFAALWGGRVFRSLDAYNNPSGGTWTEVTGITGTHPNARTVLAASDVPAAGNTAPIVYALLADATLFRLDVAIDGSFQQVSGVPQALFSGGQGYYDIVLGVDPSNPNTVYIAGDAVYPDNASFPSLSFYKGPIGGSSGSYVFPFDPANDMKPSTPVNDSSHVGKDKTFVGAGIHPDAHAIAFATNADGTHDPTNIWVGCDGGVYQSTQNGARGTFQTRNAGLAITQITYAAQHPATDMVLFAGSQDQGSLRYRGEQVCFSEATGDGGGAIFDPNNGYRVMLQQTNAELFTATDGGSSGNWTSLLDSGKFPPTASTPPAGESNDTAFYAPIAAVAVDATHTLAAFGTTRLWITPDWGQSWTTIPSNTATPYVNPGATDLLDGTAVTAIAWASPTRVYVATFTDVWRFDLSGGNWTPNPPVALPTIPQGHLITALAVENPATGTIYAALGGGGVDHVWYFDPAVNVWVSAGLDKAVLDAPAHSIVVDNPAHPDQVYLATDVGVYQGVKTGATWAWSPFPAQNNLPECAVTCLSIHPVTRILRAATHGLGVWEIPLDSANVPDPDLYLRANEADSGRVPRPAWLDGIADPTNQGATLTRYSSPDIKVLRSSRSTLDSTPDFVGFAGLKGFETDLNTFDLLGTNQVFIEVHNRGKTRVSGDQVRVLMLLADGSALLPELPADLATRLQSGDTTPDWLSAGWQFADPTNPYRALPGPLDARLPQVVQYNVDFVSLKLSPDKIAAAAFITTDTDPFTSTETDPNALVMADKHVAVRTLEKGVDWRVVLGVIVVFIGLGVFVAVKK